MKPAVVLSAHTMALGVVRALGCHKVPIAVVHYDPRDMAQCSRYVVKSYKAPHPEQDEDRFVNMLLNLDAAWQGAVLFPASDETLLLASRHKSRLSRRFEVACPDLDTVSRVIDKQRTYPLAAEAGVQVPRTLQPKSPEELHQQLDAIHYPCLVKPSQSHLFFNRFGCKMFAAENQEQLLASYQQALDAGLDILIQEYIPGDDQDVFNYNAYAVNGEVRVEFTAQHVRNAPPRYGSPRVVLSCEVPELREVGRRMLAALGYTGYACTEFKRDPRDGVFKLMEVNGRHNLSTLLSVRCGINFPWLEYRRLAYGEEPAACGFRQGIYWIDVTRDVVYSLQYRGVEHYRLREYVRPYVQSRVWAIYDRHDPLPFLKRLTYLLGHGRSSLGRLQAQQEPSYPMVNQETTTRSAKS